MSKKDVLRGIVTIVSLFMIVFFIYGTNRMGIYFNNLDYTRGIFNLGMITGLLIFGCSEFVKDYLIDIIRWLKSKKQQQTGGLNNE